MNYERIKKSLNYSIYNGISTSIADTFSSGTILIAFATMLGANNIYIGFILSLPYFANLMNFLSGYLLEKGHSCKSISIISSVISKPIYLLLALLPLLNSKNQILTFLFIFICLLYFVGNITGGVFGVWMKNLVPSKIVGKFFAKRYQYMMAATLVCYSVTYILFRHVSKGLFAYSIMFLIAFCLGLYTIYTYFMMEDYTEKKEHSEFLKCILESLKNSRFLNIMTYVGVLNFLTYLFFPFVSVFMLKSLNYSMDTVIIVTIVFQLAYIFSSKFWGNLNDKTNLRVPVFFSLIILILCVISLLFISYHHNENPNLLLTQILLLHIVLGIVNSSFKLCANNIPIICIPSEKANTLIPILSAVKSLFAGLGSAFAGILITYTFILEKQWNFANHDGWFMFFSISLVICFYLIFNIKKLQKV